MIHHVQGLICRVWWWRQREDCLQLWQGTLRLPIQRGQVIFFYYQLLVKVIKNVFLNPLKLFVNKLFMTGYQFRTFVVYCVLYQAF